MIKLTAREGGREGRMGCLRYIFSVLIILKNIRIVLRRDGGASRDARQGFCCDYLSGFCHDKKFLINLTIVLRFML